MVNKVEEIIICLYDVISSMCKGMEKIMNEYVIWIIKRLKLVICG